jgi:hypothetical protein
MSLPACQQRVLNRMEGTLRASEPHLTTMYAIFSRLSGDEPVRRERLTPRRLRWLRSGSAIYAVLLIPVMFAAVITGALLGGHSRSTCEAGYAVGGGPPLTGRGVCPSSEPAAATARSTPCPASSGPVPAGSASSGQAAASGSSPRSGQATAPPSSYLTLTGGEQDLSPPARAATAVAGTAPAVC